MLNLSKVLVVFFLLLIISSSVSAYYKIPNETRNDDNQVNQIDYVARNTKTTDPQIQNNINLNSQKDYTIEYQEYDEAFSLGIIIFFVIIIFLFFIERLVNKKF